MTLPKPFSSQQFSELLLKWYHQYGRHHLPWQQAPSSAYRTWISEIMLQQTQVTTVIPYYQKFINRFADITSLANASEDEVLSHWSGLGYYTRARNLHQTAKILVEQYQGEFPNTVTALCELPGIGRSTAGAILSLAMHQFAPILDGNVKRVLCRYHAIEGWPGQSTIQQQLWCLAEQHTPKQQTHHYNQAIMDLGATICTKKSPNCSACPVQKGCKGYLTHRPEAFPFPKAYKTGSQTPQKSPKKSVYLLIIKNPVTHSILLEKRPPIGIWGGLWSFPECALDHDIEQWCQQHLRIKVENQQMWEPFVHQFSHFQLTIHPVLLEINTRYRSPSKEIRETSPQIWHEKAAELPGGIATPIRFLLTKVFA